MAVEILEAELEGEKLSPDELAQIPGFEKIPKEKWRYPGAIVRRTLRPGEVLCREGEHGATAFYLVSGSVSISINSRIASIQSRKSARKGFFRSITKISNYVKGIPDRSDKNTPVRTHIPSDSSVDLPLDNPIATLDAGEIFGEMCALKALDKGKRAKFYPRSATVTAKTEVVVLEMLPNILNLVLYPSADFKEKLNNNYRMRALDNHLRSVPVFSGLSQEFLDYLRPRVELVDFPKGAVICRQGEAADAFFLIRLGFVKVTQEFPGGEMVLAYLSRGSYFGEMGLLPPAFRVRANGKETGQFVQCVVASEPVTGGRAPASEAGFSVPWDEYLSREHFQMRSEGRQVRVTRLASGQNPIMFQMKAAHSFLVSPGESFVAGGTTFEVLPDPLQSGVRTATCTAIDSVQLVRIKGEDFTKMLTDFPEVAASITEVARSRRQMDAEVMTRVQTISLNDFLKQELLQGQNLLLLDLDKCTRCDECVDACIATHEDNVTRLVREGLRFDHYLVPTSCRACMDPLCMTPCPVGSITRKGTLDIVIEDWCIGCGRCATECPYGNINIVEVAAGLPNKKAEPRPKAVVCDLCVEYAEPNCVRACPHDAAIRVEPRKFFAEELAGMQLAVPVQLPVTVPQQLTATQAGETRVFSSAMDLLPLLPSLKLTKADGTETALPFKSTSTTFGRGDECDYVFADDQSLSRVHCFLIFEQGRFVVRDNHSTNGTYLNGTQVNEAELQDGDVLRMGNLEFTFRAGRAQ